MIVTVPMDLDPNYMRIIIETLTTVGGVGVVVYKLGRAMEKFESVGKQQAKEITELKGEVKIIGEVLIKIALTTQRQDTLEERINRNETMLDELRRGEGFIQKKISHEYP